MGKISLKGIIAGGVADIVATNLLMVPVVFYLMHGIMKTETAPQAISDAATQALRHDPVYFTISIIMGGLGSLLGGYVAARIADRNELLNGALSAIFCWLLGLYAVIWSHNDVPLIQHIIFWIASPPLGMLGGYLRSRPVYTGY